MTWWNALASYKTAVMQVSGLRSFREGRSDEPYRPTRRRAAGPARRRGPAPPGADPGPATPAPVPAGPGARSRAADDGPGADDHVVGQHLAGARRLVELAAADPGLSPAGAALLADARRLIRQAASTWATALPTLVADNSQLADLLAGLGAPPAPVPSPTPADADARHDRSGGGPPP